MRAREANIQTAATKVTNMPYGGNDFVCSLLNELNSKKYCNLFGFHLLYV